jgi:hypothetical protein
LLHVLGCALWRAKGRLRFVGQGFSPDIKQNGVERLPLRSLTRSK